eukprot:PhM_4_TR2077/c2_g1_i3/m.6891
MQHIWNFLYTSTIDPDDDFRTRTRKAVIAAGALYSIANIFAVTQLTARIIFQEEDAYTTKDMALGCITSIMNAVAVLWAWIHQKRTKTNVSSTGMMFWHLTNWLTFLMHILTNMRQFHVIATLFVVVAVVINSHVKLNIVLWVLIIVINMYNLSFGEYTDLPYIGVTYPQTMFGAATVQITSIIAFFLIVKLVKVQTKEYVRMLARADKSLEVAMAVAQHLARYDTESAAAAVVAADADDNDTSDTRLLRDTLRRIVSNMELYRPFLPNYLLQTTDTQLGDEDSDDQESDVPEDHPAAGDTMMFEEESPLESRPDQLDDTCLHGVTPPNAVTTSASTSTSQSAISRKSSLVSSSNSATGTSKAHVVPAVISGVSLINNGNIGVSCKHVTLGLLSYAAQFAAQQPSPSNNNAQQQAAD